MIRTLVLALVLLAAVAAPVQAGGKHHHGGFHLDVGIGIVAPPYAYSLLTLDATAFWNDLHDAVGNVTIARGPGTFPIVGTLAAGGLGRQRLNLDRMGVQGLELSAKWTPTATSSPRASVAIRSSAVRAR